MEPSELRQYSIITWFFERSFNLLQWMSIATWLFKTRVGIQKQFDPDSNKEAITKKRGTNIELYVISWFITELILIVLVYLHISVICAVGPLLAGYRVFDIVQASLNLNLFDRLRVKDKQLYVSSLARTVILSVWNYIEMGICFGVIYACNLRYLRNAKDIVDAYYFSGITQLTIGYGDLSPTVHLRLLAVTQGFLGFVLALFALSRVISFLPKTLTVYGDD